MLILIGVICLAVIVLATEETEPFSPDTSKLAIDVKKQIDEYIVIEKGGLEKVAITGAEITGTERSGMMSAITMAPMWKARIRAKPKLFTTTGVFIGRSITIEGTGNTEDDAIYDAKRGMSIFRRVLQNMLS